MSIICRTEPIFNFNSAQERYVLVSLFPNQNVCCGYSKGDSFSIKHPKHMLNMMGKEIFTLLADLFCLPKPVNYFVKLTVKILTRRLVPESL